MSSTSLHPRTYSTSISVILLLIAASVATATAATGTVALAADGPRQAAALGGTSDSAANATVYVAPGDAGNDLENSSAIARRIEDGTLVRPSTSEDDPSIVTVNDTLVVAVAISGLEERLAAAPGENTTARMRTLVDGENATLSVVEQNPTTERPAMVADILATASTRVVAGDGGTAYLVVDVDEVVVEYSSPDHTREKLIDAPYYNRIFRVNFTLDDTSATTSFLTQPPEATVPRPPGSGTALLPTATNATLVGRTNLAPGTDLQVSVVDNETDRKLVDSTVPVDDCGRFTTTVDTTGLANTTLEVRVALGSTAFDPIPVAVRREGASLQLSDQEGDGQRVVVDQVELSHGGVLVVRGNSSEGPIVGETALEVGEHSDVAVTLEEPLTGSRTLVITAHRDVNGNGTFDDALDESYGESASATYRVESDGDPTATRTATTDGDTATDAAATQDDAPGLGVRTTLIALVAVLAIARYRRRR